MTDVEMIGGTLVAGWTAARLFGPSIEHLGKELQGATAEGVERIKRLMLRTSERTSPREQAEEGGIPPRILVPAIREAALNPDDLAVEYLAGVLAASRTDGSVAGELQDDRAVVHIASLSRLSVHALRLHFLIYRRFSEFPSGHVVDGSMLWGGRLLVHGNDIDFPMHLNTVRDRREIQGLRNHAEAALEREGLISIDRADTDRAHFRMVDNMTDIRHVPDLRIYDEETLGTELFEMGIGKQRVSGPTGEDLPSLSRSMFLMDDGGRSELTPGLRARGVVDLDEYVDALIAQDRGRG